jgi:predicted RNA-binding Zn-ribbon protein involved in translation (DUF1610 family)
MLSVKIVNCQSCGAQLKPEPGAERVACEYCGVTSVVSKRTDTRSPLTGSLRVAAGVFFGIATVIGLASFGVSWLSSRGRSNVSSVRTPLATASPTAPSSAPDAAASRLVQPARSNVSVRSSFAPLAFELGGDRGQGFAVPILVHAQPNNAEYFATYDADGVELARTPELSLSDIKLHAVVANQLITASNKGQLTAYAMPGGAQQWTTALGDRVFAICQAKSAEAMTLVLEDDSRLSVDVTTGRQSATREECKVGIALNEHRLDARNRHDYAAPTGMDSFRCGGVRVMGSENYTVSDPCRNQAGLSPERLKELDASRIWKVSDAWLVFGVRKPGLRIPMLGLMRRGKVVWSSLVPAETPLEADEGPPYRATLLGDAVAVAYRSRSGKETRNFVTVFEIAGGTRRWTRAVSSDPKSLVAVTLPARLLVQGDSGLEILDGSDGHRIGTVGRVD